jgi:hypothetical protein
MSTKRRVDKNPAAKAKRQAVRARRHRQKQLQRERSEARLILLAQERAAEDQVRREAMERKRIEDLQRAKEFREKRDAERMEAGVQRDATKREGQRPPIVVYDVYDEVTDEQFQVLDKMSEGSSSENQETPAVEPSQAD